MTHCGNKLSISTLHSKPLQKVPSKLFYKTEMILKDCIHTKDSSTQEVKAFRYTMADTKTGQYAGEMIAAPMEYANTAKRFYPIKSPYRSFYIDYLKTTESGLGYGTEFIKLAKNESKKYNCNGRVHLIASRLYDRNRPPHIFYKKCGFMSQSVVMNTYLDRCIRWMMPMDLAMADNLDMFLPIDKVVKNSISKFITLITYLKQLKNKL